MQQPEPDWRVFAAGDLQLASGEVLHDARLAYATHGRLNAAGDNCVVVPTYYTGTHRSYEPMIGPGRALDPERHFIVVPNLFGNGISTSPSNAAPPCAGGHFPHLTILDNVRCQHRLLTEELGVHEVALVAGWSMGAVQAFQWAASYPEMVDALLPWCGSARCAPHNRVFLEGLRATLSADCLFEGGFYDTPPRAGLAAFGRVYAGWAYSQTFYRDGLYRDLGFEDVDALLEFWERDHLAWDANDLLAKLWTWEHADLGANETYQGDFAAALGAIRARAIVMPCDHDLYFTVEDSRREVALMPNAELRPLRSAWGHCAGAPGRNPVDTAFVEAAIRELLGG